MTDNAANVLNNALMLSMALAMFYLLDGWWKLFGIVPLLCITYHFGFQPDAAHGEKTKEKP